MYINILILNEFFIGVELCQNGIASAVASEDSDTLTFGAQTLLKGYDIKNKTFQQIKLSEILILLIKNLTTHFFYLLN